MSISAGQGLKLTWREFKKLCENAGISDADEIDSIDVCWGGAEDLTCIKDEDFGWQIQLRAD